MKTITEVRKAFWEAYPEYKKYRTVKKRQNQYNTDVRTSFCDYVDYLQKDGVISYELANKVTL